MVVKFYIGDSDTVQVMCPNCGKSKNIDITKYKKSQHIIQGAIKCACGSNYPFLLERRRSFRKKVSLVGVFKRIQPGPGPEKGLMIILDLSRSGMKIRRNTDYGLKLGEPIAVAFHLDNPEQSLIKRQAIVKAVMPESIGIQFDAHHADDDTENLLSYYLLRLKKK